MQGQTARCGKFFHRFGVRLLRDSAYPSVGVGIARAIVDPDATIAACLADATLLFLFILTAAGLCLVCSWVIRHLNQ